MRSLTLAAALLSLVGACHSATEPPPPADIFVLATVDGRALPTTRAANPSSNGASILFESLVLGDDGVATRRTTLQESSTSAPTTTIVTYAYTRVGDVITLGNVLCGPGALCIQHFPEQGPIDHGFLTLGPVPSLLPTGGSVLVYQRPTIID